MGVTIYRSRKGLTAYCAACRTKWHSDDPRYEPNENALRRFEKEHEHEHTTTPVRSEERT